MDESREQYWSDNWNISVPAKIDSEGYIPKNEEEAAYLGLVRLCQERTEWHPGTSGEECAGWGEIAVQLPDDTHPVLDDPKYHRYGMVSEPLNRRGRRKLAWMQYKFKEAADRYWNTL